MTLSAASPSSSRSPGARAGGGLRRRTKYVLGALLALLVVVYLGLGAVVSLKLARPRRSFDPERSPAAQKLAYTDVRFPARGGDAQIAAWYVQHAAGRHVLVIVHGKDSSRTREHSGRTAELMARLYRRGFALLAIDLRGHGQSSDARLSFGIHEHRDILGAVDWLRAQGYPAGSIGVLGVSLGGASTILAAAREPAIGAAVGAAVALLADSATAQTGFVDTTGFGFVPLNGPIVLNQAFGDGQNIAGIVQLAPNPTATVNQNGFYSRTAIIQVDGTNTANITQFGDFSHAYVIQVGPTNASTIAQTGNNVSAIVIQLAASPIAAAGTGYLERLAANLLFAPETAAALPSMAQISAQGFARDMLSQLDTGRAETCIDNQPLTVKAPLSPCRASAFVQVNYRHGDHADAFGSTRYSYDSAGVLAGGKFYVTPNLTVGPTFGYTHIASGFKQGLGSTDLDSFHLGGFLAYDTNSLFVHVVGAYGWNQFDIARTGFFGPITPTTDGNSSVAAIKAGYLFDLGAIGLGPIGGFTYSDTHVRGYSETGDPLLTQTVADQFLRSAVISGGVRFQPRFAGLGPRADTFLDVTAEKDLHDSMPILQTVFTLAPNVPIFTPVRPIRDTYVRISGGLGYDFAPNARVNIAAEGIVANNGSNSLGVNAGFRYGF